MAERLGTGLQNRLQQFESAWYLKDEPPEGSFFLLFTAIKSTFAR